MKRIVMMMAILAVVITPLTVGLAQDDNAHRETDPFWNPTDALYEEWAMIDGVEDGATVTWWTMSLSPTFDEYIQQIIDNFEATYPGVEVVWEDQPWDQLQDKTRNAFAAGNAPDVINLNPAWVAEFAEADLLMDMDAALADYPDVRDNYVDGAFNTAAYNGTSYQIPWYLGLSNFLGYNTAVLDDLGLTEDDLPTTWDEVYTFAEDVREMSEGDYYGLSLNFGSGVERNLLPYLLYNDVPVYEDGDVVLDPAAGAEDLQLWANLIGNDLVPRESINEDHRKMVERFASGETAIIMIAPHLLRLVEENNPDVYANMGIAPGVVGSSGKNAVDVQSLVVPQSTEYPNASLALATFITNAETQAAFSKEAGIFPSNLDSYEDEFFSTTEDDNPVSSIRPLAHDYVVTAENRTLTFPNDAEVQQAIINAQNAALLGQKTPEEALADLADQIAELTSE